MSVVSKKNRNDAERVAEISRKLMENPEMAEVIQELGRSATDANDLARGLLQAFINAGLNAELDAHLGYEHGDRSAKAVEEQPNSRNGFYPKTVSSTFGPVDISVPRDRNGTFIPQMVPRGARRLTDLDDMIISLYAGGMTTRDIEYHLKSTIGVQLSPDTISAVTDAVLDEVLAWQNRQLDEFYPVIFLDALQVKIRDGGRVTNKAVYMAVGVDMDGIKHILGLWVSANEGAAFWSTVCAEIANRGVRDVFIVCCDGLKGLPEAVEATWPNSMVQTCVVHLIRAANRWVSHKDRKEVSAHLRSIYTAANAEEALTKLEKFEASELGQRYPQSVKVWRDAWDRFIPFLQFPPMARKVIYTTNSIESMNNELRKATRNRGHFPSDSSAIKTLWLMICNIEDRRANRRAKEGKKAASSAKRLVEGTRTTNWNQAINQLAVAYPDRFAPYL
ncbi:transposase [Corynebacterium phocae]|uniref:Mutator family transposase n=1 Tax=Corynebacterium phocae TaxID=161895 RepID=A0A1L7D187_9CORY|nr:IS256 family transposase [Corynebacterium phocae]APT91801.1 transposase [Corynebacterium phocae]APT91858.1 transposase [Corynebacterium phocae]KAA8727981.1 IS256 family transposase [Corynebacterium phocae]